MYSCRQTRARRNVSETQLVDDFVCLLFRRETEIRSVWVVAGGYPSHGICHRCSTILLRLPLCTILYSPSKKLLRLCRNLKVTTFVTDNRINFVSFPPQKGREYFYSSFYTTFLWTNVYACRLVIHLTFHPWFYFIAEIMFDATVEEVKLTHGRGKFDWHEVHLFVSFELSHMHTSVFFFFLHSKP